MLTLNRKTIGIFGGSFDPPHEGHVEISKIALKKIKFKKIFWIITKKNPFKKKPFFSVNQRVAKSKSATKSIKRVKVLYLDKKIGSSRTIDVIKYFIKTKKLMFMIFPPRLRHCRWCQMIAQTSPKLCGENLFSTPKTCPERVQKSVQQVCKTRIVCV